MLTSGDGVADVDFKALSEFHQFHYDYIAKALM